MVLTVSWTSIVWHSATGLPLSRLSSTASSCRLRSISLAKAISTRLRSAGGWLRQRPSSKASRALRTARSTSALPQAATRASRSPVAGLVVGNVSPETAGRAMPSMKALPPIAMLAAMALYSPAVSRSLMVRSST